MEIKLVKKLFVNILINILKVIIILFSMLLFIYSQYFFPIGSSISDGVTQNNLALLKSKMDENKVIEILGEPLSKEYPDYDANHDYSLIYAKQGILNIGGLRMFILIKNKKLIYLEIADSYDDGIYSCTEKKCPVFIDQDNYNKLIPKT